MGDVPQIPGGGQNPFPFDLNEIMRYLQAPGPVNMEIARSTADAAAQLDAGTQEPKADPAVTAEARRAFDDVVQAVQLAVSEATGIAAALTIPTRTVDRAGWSRTTLDGLSPVLASLASALRGGMPETDLTNLQGMQGMQPDAFFAALMQPLIPLLLGMWSGNMIGTLSHHALGQYDLPLPIDAAPELLFVASNVDAFAAEWELPADELRYAVALREMVHGAQRAVPWVRARLARLSSEYVAAYDVEGASLEDQLGDFDMNDPTAAMAQLGNPELFLNAMRSDAQDPILEELQRFVSVLEGYTDVVVESVGNRMVPAHARIDEALRRHRLERGDATAFVDRLLGLELDRGHYDAGVTFCRGVIERSDGGFEQLNRLWTGEDLLPTRSEFEAPGLWLARIDLPTD